MTLAKNGVYRLPSVLNLSGYSGITLDGNGAEIIFTDNSNFGFAFSGCSDITIKNLTVDMDPLPFTQGTVTSISANGMEFTMQPDAGYRSDTGFIQNTCIMTFMDRGGRHNIPGTMDYYSAAAGDVQSVSDTEIHIKSQMALNGKNIASQTAVQVGDAVLLRSTLGHMFAAYGCGSFDYENVNLWCGGGMGFVEWFGDGGSVYDHVSVTPGPPPAGATEQRLSAVNSDAMHFTGLNKGPTVENCLIENMGDDGINVGGISAYVGQLIDDKTYTVIAASPADGFFAAGDTLEFNDGATYGYIAKAGLVSAEAYTGADTSALDAVRKKIWTGKAGVDTFKYYTITLDSPVALKVGDIAADLDRIGAGAVIKDSTFRNNRGRGIVVTTSNATVENNTIENTTWCGIQASNEVGYWSASDFSNDLTIKGNTISNAGIGANMRMTTSDMFGSINLTVDLNLNQHGPFTGRAHKGVLIEDNKIDSPNVPALVIMNADSVTVSGNAFTNVMQQQPEKLGASMRLTPDGAVIVAQSDNVSVTNNNYSLGAYAKEFLQDAGGTSALTQSGNTAIG